MKKNLFVFVLLFILLILVGCNSYKNITITYFINDISIVKNYDDKIIITEDVICTITDYEIEGVYLDCEYNLLYEDEVISENIDIFIKIKEDKKEEERKKAKRKRTEDKQYVLPKIQKSLPICYPLKYF